MKSSSLSFKHQAHCIVGSTDQTAKFIIKELQSFLCTTHNESEECSTCTLIHKQSHPATIWLNPETDYNSQALDDLIGQTKYKLNSKEYRFFIFLQAEQISDTCFNKLLKTIEEPLPQYYFIFLTESIDAILETVQSRCHVQSIYTTEKSEEFDYFFSIINNPENNPIQYLSVIDKAEWNEHKVQQFLDYAISKSYDNILKAFKEENRSSMIYHAQQLAILQEELQNLPATGSSKLFLKNLFLTLHQNYHATVAFKQI